MLSFAILRYLDMVAEHSDTLDTLDQLLLCYSSLLVLMLGLFKARASDEIKQKSHSYN